MTNTGISLNEQAVINALATAVRACVELGNPVLASDLSQRAIAELEALLYSGFNAQRVWKIMMDRDCSLASACREFGLEGC